MASTYLTRSLSSAGSLTTFTISAWVKRSNLGASNTLFQSQANGGYFRIQFDTNNKINILDDNSGVNKTTSQVFRDTSAWYHLVFAFNSTESTSSLRDRLYVNGEEVTSWSTNTPSTQNNSYRWQENSQLQNIGRHGDNTEHYNGLMSHVNCIDGLQLSASDFGSTDANGVWKIKTSPSVTYGTNGFFILKDGNSVTDQSGNSNNFTVGGGTLTNTEDSPSNVFATLNPLYKPYASATFSEGNLKISTATGWSGNKATMGVSQGKWYWEIKLSGTMTDHQHGVQQENVNEGVSNPENTIGTTVFFNQDGGEMKTNGTATTADYGLFSTGDIMGVALDMDSGSYGQITIYKNGTPLVSNFNLSSSSTLVMPFSSIVNSTAEYNFGNGYFGTTAVASAGTNASGNGIFEYDVPTGYTALSTKGLNL